MQRCPAKEAYRNSKQNNLLVKVLVCHERPLVCHPAKNTLLARQTAPHQQLMQDTSPLPKFSVLRSNSHRGNHVARDISERSPCVMIVRHNLCHPISSTRFRERHFWQKAERRSAGEGVRR